MEPLLSLPALGFWVLDFTWPLCKHVGSAGLLTRLHEGEGGHLGKKIHIKVTNIFKAVVQQDLSGGVVPILGGRFGHILRGMLEIC